MNLLSCYTHTIRRYVNVAAFFFLIVAEPSPRFPNRIEPLAAIYPRTDLSLVTELLEGERYAAQIIPAELRFAGLGLNERQMKALEHLLAHGRIARSDYQTVAATTERTAKRDLNELVKKQVLMKRGAGNNFWYELVGPQPQQRSSAGRGAK